MLHLKSAKSREIHWNFKLIEFKVIQGLGSNRKHICTFLLATNSNFGRISYHFRDTDSFSAKISCFPTPPLFDAPCGGTPWDINVICTLLKSAFNGLQFHNWHYRSIFIRLAIVASKIAKWGKFQQNLTLQQFKVIQGHRSWCQSKAHMQLSISH